MKPPSPTSAVTSLNGRFETFLKRVLPTPAQLDLAKRELDFLEGKLGKFIQEDDPLEFVKALRAGSYAKHTMLRRHRTGDFDVDLGVYVRSEDGSEAPLADLLDYVERLLDRAYKQRTERRPRIDRSSKSSVKVCFDVTPRITIDVTPIVALEHSSIPNWGVIPRRDGERRHTSVTEHVHFVTERNGRDPTYPFNQIVRLWKWWRDHRFGDGLKDKVSSFALELVLGRAFDEGHPQPKDGWLKVLQATAASVVRHGLRTPIEFPDPRVPAPDSPVTGPVVVLDPLNRSNNVTHDWSVSDRRVFVDAVTEFCDLIREAQLCAEDGDEQEAVSILDREFPEFRNWSVD